MEVVRADILASIPAPSVRDLELGPLDIRLYALCLLAGVVVATWVTMIRWKEQGGDPDLVLEVALWSVLFGLIGGRLYHVITSWDQLGDEWYAPFAIWEGGLGIWGGVALGVVAGAYVTHRRGASVLAMMDAAAPGILIAQGIGRLGNYFNQELFGGPTDLPWGLEVDPSERPDAYPDNTTFHPTFLYEMLWNFAGAALIIWAGKRFRLRPPGRLLPLRGDLLAGADLLGAAPGRPVARVPRAARELLRRPGPVRRGDRLLRLVAAPAGRRGAGAARTGGPGAGRAAHARRPGPAGPQAGLAEVSPS